MDEVFEIEDILSSKTISPFYIHSSLWPEKTGRHKVLLHKIEYIYFIYLKPLTFRFLGILCALLSLLIILGESGLYTSNPSNIFPLLVHYNNGTVLSELFCLIPLLYIVFSTISSLFELKVEGKYGFYKKNHTHPSSLIHCSCFISRLVPVLSYNFLLLLDVKNTEFLKVINLLDIIPYLGDQYSRYFPTLISLFCLLNIFNVYNRIMKKIGLENYTFEEVLNLNRKPEGKALLAKARIQRERLKRYDPEKISEKTVSLIGDFEESFTVSESLQY